ncbi:hypothetical protein BT96DRAFT_942690 [Gymnopus androsaceus JB14]|uniref:Uncharacterized protein n=1 Tax=Gymnopus androsaceus JB14 TaxID=1447944 RepID=A0A6A4HB77_9AGAR|nr:hypothetical protein BT96DRAFT_942690 [Gymnopus androsaceus JB14]
MPGVHQDSVYRVDGRIRIRDKRPEPIVLGFEKAEANSKIAANDDGHDEEDRGRKVPKSDRHLSHGQSPASDLRIFRLMGAKLSLTFTISLHRLLLSLILIGLGYQYNSERWSSALSRICSCEPEAETELKAILKDIDDEINRLELQLFTVSSPRADFSPFRSIPTSQIDAELYAELPDTPVSIAPTTDAVPSQNLPKVKMSLKEYMVKKRQAQESGGDLAPPHSIAANSPSSSGLVISQSPVFHIAPSSSGDINMELAPPRSVADSSTASSGVSISQSPVAQIAAPSSSSGGIDVSLNQHPLCWAWFQAESGDFQHINIPGLPGAPNIVLLQLACLQRVFLETYARLQWLEKWIPRLKDVDHAFVVDPTIMGTFTDDLNKAVDLFKIGIPMWLIGPCLDKDFNHKLPIRDSEALLDVSDNDPPYPTIYMGLPGHYKCYARMGLFFHQQFSPALIRHSKPSRGNPAAERSNPVEIECLSVTQREWVSSPHKMKRTKTGKAETGNMHEMRNCFMPIIHESFPKCLPTWDMASVHLAELQHFTGPSLLEHALPDPSIFITPEGTLKPALIMSWLHVCPVFLWHLGMPNSKSYTNKQWRAMLEAADGFHVSGSDWHSEMLVELKALVKDSHSIGININEDFIVSAPVTWNGVVILGALDSQVIQEVVWELYEVNFWMEVLMLDRYMVPEPEGDSKAVEMEWEIWLEREVQAYHCWVGVPYCPQYHTPGLSSYLPDSSRCPYLKALFNLIRAWGGEKPRELWQPFPAENDQNAVWEVEDILANYYVWTFLKMYHCPATIPHVAVTA